MPSLLRTQLAASAGIVALTAAAAWAPALPFYLTNDDVAMRLLAEGRLAPNAAPTAFLLFMHVAIGWMLKSLYTTMKEVPWYDLLLLITAAAAALTLVTEWSKAGWTRSLLLSGLLLVPLFSTPQFSLVGMTCAAAGLVVLVGAGGKHDWRRSKMRIALAVSVFAWSTLIRAEGAALLLCQATLSAILLSLLHLKPEGPGWRRIITAAVLAGVIPLAALLTQIAAYHYTVGWQEFPEYNYTRGMLTEYAAAGDLSSERLSALHAVTGWSVNDLLLLRGWFFEHPSVFSLDKLRAALVVLRDDSQRRDHMTLWRASSSVRSILSDTWLAMLALVIVAASGTRPLQQIARTFLLLLVFLVLASLVSVWLKELPSRVYWPMLILAAGLAIDPTSAEHTQAFAIVCLLTGAMLVCLMTAGRWREQRQRATEAREVASDVGALDRLAPSLVAIHADALRWEYIWRPFHRTTLALPFLAIGASSRTPPIQEAVRRQGRADLIDSICSTDGVVLIARPWVPAALTVFMKEHYARDVWFDPVLEGRTFTVWRCRSAH